MSQFWREIRRSLRSLMKRPGFLAAAVLTLALGIGANTSLFSVVNAVLLRQLPFAHADRTVWITGVRPDRNDAPFSLPDFLDYRDHTDSLDSISAVGSWSGNLTGRGDAERLTGVRASANVFETLGVNAAVGRTLEPEDDRPGAPSVVVMSTTSTRSCSRCGTSICFIAIPTSFYHDMRRSCRTGMMRLRMLCFVNLSASVWPIPLSSPQRRRSWNHGSENSNDCISPQSISVLRAPPVRRRGLHCGGPAEVKART